MPATKNRRASHQLIEAVSNATPELFVTSTTSEHDSLWDRTIDIALQQGMAPYSLLDDEDVDLEALNHAARLLFDAEVVHDWATFDDDERWRETARTGRAL